MVRSSQDNGVVETHSLISGTIFKFSVDVYYQIIQLLVQIFKFSMDVYYVDRLVQ